MTSSPFPFPALRAAERDLRRAFFGLKGPQALTVQGETLKGRIRQLWHPKRELLRHLEQCPDLAKAARKVLDERNRAVEGCLESVPVGILRRHFPNAARRPELREELLAAGQLALVEAAETFQPWRGFTLGTYAERRIVAAMWEALQHSQHMGPTLPERVRRKIQLLRKAEFSFLNQHGRRPSWVELAALSPLPRWETEELASYFRSEDLAGSSKSSCPDADGLPSEDDPFARYLSEERSRSYRRLLAHLAPAQRHLLAAVHLQGTSIAALSRRLGQSPFAVRRQLAEAEACLRASVSRVSGSWEQAM